MMMNLIKAILSKKRFFPYILLILAILFFISFRFYTISAAWDGRITPVEPDDSIDYIAKIRVIGEPGQFFHNLNDIWSSNKNDHLTFLPWSTILAITGQLNNNLFAQVYQLNFYFGILVLVFAILYITRTLENNKYFLALTLFFLAFYNGSGEYHGFFWVVPTFYSVIFTFLLLALLFDKNNNGLTANARYVLIFITSLLLLLSHPLGEFSFIAVALSFLLYFAFVRIGSRLNSLNIRLGLSKDFFILIVSGLIVIFLVSFLPYYIGISSYTYPVGTQIVNLQPNAYESFKSLYLNNFAFNTFNFSLIFIGLFAAILAKKFSIISIFSGFFFVALLSANFENGQRFLVYLWPISFIVFSYGFFFLIKKAYEEWTCNGHRMQIRLPKNKRLINIKVSKIGVISLVFVFLVSVNYVFPFIQNNYAWNNESASIQRDRMADWKFDPSIINYINNNTKQGDLIIFSDTNAFQSVTAMGVLNRQVVYGNWDWNGQYRSLMSKVNGSYLVATNSPYSEDLSLSSLSFSLKNLTDAFDGHLSFVFTKNFGVLSVYKTVVNQAKVTLEFNYPAIDPRTIADDNQVLYWSTSKQIGLTNDYQNMINGSSSLNINISQTANGQNDYIYHSFSSPQNWLSKDILRFYWFGNGDNKRIEILLYAPDSANKFTYAFRDSSQGWSSVVIPLSDFTSTTQNASLSVVSAIYFRFTLDSPYVTNYKLDQVLLDVPTEGISGTNLTAEGVGIGISLQIMLTFILLLFPVGLLWSYLVFKIRTPIRFMAISVGLSFFLVFIALFLSNLLLGVEITGVSTIVIIAILLSIPLLFDLLQKSLKRTRFRVF